MIVKNYPSSIWCKDSNYQPCDQDNHTAEGKCLVPTFHPAAAILFE